MKAVAEVSSQVVANDAHLARTVRNSLAANRLGFRQLQVEVEVGVVRLSGSVASFYLKQTAIAIAKQVAGIYQVVDELDVETGNTNAL